MVVGCKGKGWGMVKAVKGRAGVRVLGIMARAGVW